MSPANGVPCSLTQGDSVVFSYANPDFPSTGWTLKLAMLKDGQSTLFPSTGQTDGSYVFTILPAATASLPPGQYVARLVATSNDGTQRQTLCQTCPFVYPDPSQPLKLTPEMIALAALKQVSAGTIQSYSGGGQTWSKRNLAELRQEIDRLQVIVNNQLTELGLSAKGGSRTIVTRFGF